MDGWTVVTGASSGIGEQFALSLGRRGDRLLLTGRSRERLDAAAARIGGRTEVLVADLATDDGLSCLEDAIASRPVTLLVANAGTGDAGRLADQDLAAMAATVAVNLTAVARLVRAALPGMTARGDGGIVLVSSSAAVWPAPDAPLYAATKAAVESLSRSLRADAGPRGVRVTCVRPGWIRTPFHDRHGTDAALVEDRFWREPTDVVTAALDANARDVELVEVPEPGLRERLHPYLVKLRGR